MNQTSKLDRHHREKSIHQQRVEHFMTLIGHTPGDGPFIPCEKTRLLRARLLLEECLETIEALGVEVTAINPYTKGEFLFDSEDIKNDKLDFNIVNDANLIAIIDGCCDLKVVTTGTLSAFGISDNKPQELVDINNLAKFNGWTKDEINTSIQNNTISTATHNISQLPNGNWMVRLNNKLIKSPSHQPPNLELEIKRQEQLSKD